MSTPSQDPHVNRIRSKILRFGAALGVVLGLLCGALPPHYHDMCNNITQIAGITCGGAGGHHP